MKNLTNQRFGRLTAIKPVGKDKRGNYKWLCKCDCGNETVVCQGDLSSGHTKSCGCYSEEAKRNSDNKYKKHDLWKHPLYHVWVNMRQRCYRPPNMNTKKNYQDRGITVCDEWLHDFKAFYDWSIANGWSDETFQSKKNRVHKLTIDRIDNNKGYSPDNCRWVDMKVQSNNRRPYKITHTYKQLVKTTLHYKNETLIQD